jgi:hypothetical protein
MKRIFLIILLLLSYSVFGFGQKEYYIETININLPFAFRENNQILFIAKDGCPKSGLVIMQDYYTEELYEEKYIIITTFEELNIYKNKYFTLPFLETINEDFFKESNLVFIVQHYTGGTFFKNESIINDAGFYTLKLEKYGINMDPIPACAYKNLYVIKLPK